MARLALTVYHEDIPVASAKTIADVIEVVGTQTAADDARLTEIQLHYDDDLVKKCLDSLGQSQERRTCLGTFRFTQSECCLL